MILICKGREQDAERVSNLLLETSEEFISGELSEIGKQNLRSEFSVKNITEKMIKDNFRFYLAKDGDDIVGVIAIEDDKHICYLFVAKSHQGQGISRALWEGTKSKSLIFNESGVFTVNSSNYAIKAYQKLGFVLTRTTQEKNGILYNPMKAEC